jgi:hypothetical protein
LANNQWHSSQLQHLLFFARGAFLIHRYDLRATTPVLWGISINSQPQPDSVVFFWIKCHISSSSITATFDLNSAL